MLDAAAAGTPIIAYRSGASRESAGATKPAAPGCTGVDPARREQLERLRPDWLDLCARDARGLRFNRPPGASRGGSIWAAAAMLAESGAAAGQAGGRMQLLLRAAGPNAAVAGLRFERRGERPFTL